MCFTGKLKNREVSVQYDSRIYVMRTKTPAQVGGGSNVIGTGSNLRRSTDTTDYADHINTNFKSVSEEGQLTSSLSIENEKSQLQSSCDGIHDPCFSYQTVGFLSPPSPQAQEQFCVEASIAFNKDIKESMRLKIEWKRPTNSDFDMRTLLQESGTNQGKLKLNSVDKSGAMTAKSAGGDAFFCPVIGLNTKDGTTAPKCKPAICPEKFKTGQTSPSLECEADTGAYTNAFVGKEKDKLTFSFIVNTDADANAETVIPVSEGPQYFQICGFAMPREVEDWEDVRKSTFTWKLDYSQLTTIQKNGIKWINQEGDVCPCWESIQCNV
jgi:hypothetical protein